MRILVLSVNYWPEETGIGPLTAWRCEYLASRGHDVTVCTTLPYYPQWRVSEPYKRALWRCELHKGVKILRSWSWIPKQVTAAKRIVFEATFLMGNLIAALSAGKTRSATGRIAAPWTGTHGWMPEKAVGNTVRLRRDGFAARCRRRSGHVA